MVYACQHAMSNNVSFPTHDVVVYLYMYVHSTLLHLHDPTNTFVFIVTQELMKLQIVHIHVCAILWNC